MNSPVEDVRQAVASLRSIARRVELIAPGAKWYLFGSALRAFERAADIDVLIVSDTHESSALVRQELDGLCRSLPLHLLLLTTEEENELSFIVAQRCVQVFPSSAMKGPDGRSD